MTGATGEPTEDPPVGTLWRLRRVIFLAFLLSVAGVGAFLIVLAQIGTPVPHVPGATTFLTYDNGQPLATFSPGFQRTPEPLSAISPAMVKALLANEDRTYFSQGALDPRGVLRAAVSDITGHPLEGGSTLAQQYVKNVYLSQARTISRKLEELVLAERLTREISKRQLLDDYLNVVYFGRGAYGVQAASEAYFGEPASKLNDAQAALLGGLIRSPDTADPYFNPRAALRRYRTSLQSMVASGYLSQRLADRLGREPLTGAGGLVVRPTTNPVKEYAVPGTGYFVAYARQRLIARFGETETDAGGLEVRTSLDPTLQSEAYSAVYGFLRPGEPAGALVSIGPTGNIEAMVGGRSFQSDQVNLATGTLGGGSGRQPGSTFKAFLLAAAFSSGMSPDAAFPAPPTITLTQANGKPYVVSNDAYESFPTPINIAQATAESINTVFVQLEEKVGLPALVAEAHELGITSPLPSDDLSLVLGSADVSVLEMADAYSTFADNGVHYPARALLDVTSPDGTQLLGGEPTGRQVLTPSVVSDIDYCLQGVVKYGTGQAAAIGRPLAGKTGTSEHEGDAWFIGYTPQLTTAVWMGYPQGESYHMTDVRGITVVGGSFPAEMFSHYMSEAMAPLPVEAFPPPASLAGTSPDGLMTTGTVASGPFGSTTTTSSTTSTTNVPTSTSSTTATSSTVVTGSPTPGRSP